MKILRFILPVLVLLIVAAQLFQEWGTNKGNKLVDEGNAAVEAANKLATDAGTKYEALFTDENGKAFPGNRSALDQPAREAADLLGKSAEQFKIASAKFTEAATVPADEHVTAYWKLKAAELGKLGEVKSFFQARCLLFVDPTVDSEEKLLEKIKEGNPKLEAMIAEQHKARDDAQKIADEYPDMLK